MWIRSLMGLTIRYTHKKSFSFIVVACLLMFLVISACDDSGIENTTPGITGVSGFGASSNMNEIGGSPATSNNNDNVPSQTDTGTGGDVNGTGGQTTGGAETAGQSGFIGTAGMIVDGGPADGTTDDTEIFADSGPEPIDIGPLEPRIPELSGEPCPAFNDGMERILTQNTIIRAGEPGPVKGPLLFAFHFTGGQAMEAMAGVSAVAQNEIVAEGGLVLAPQSDFRGQGDDIAIPTNTWFENDLPWVDHVVSCAVANHNIDPKRIYAVGCSAGGLMAGTLALMRSEYMAAVGPNSGGINYPGHYHLSDPAHSPAVMTLCGGAIDNVIINFCQSSTWMHTEIIDKAQSGGFIVNCNHGRGHCGGTFLSTAVWEFLKAHPFGTPSPWKDGLPAGSDPSCEIIWPGAD